MILSKFYTSVVMRVILLTITCIALSYALIKKTDLYVSFNILLLLVIQVFLLFRYVNRINRDLTIFFDAISHDDATVLYKKVAPARSFERLYELFDQISLRIQNLRLENSRRSFYLQHLVDNAGIGILSYTAGGKIDMINPAAKQLLNLSHAKKIQHLDDFDTTLAAQLRELRSGEQCLLKTKRDIESVPLSIRASEFVIQEETIHLLTFQSIKNELEDNELVSWQKLIRTLTHEIMNSIGPISSSIKTIRSFYEKEAVESCTEEVKLPRDTLTDTIRGLDIIDERAQGMLGFVSKFRSLTVIPTLNLTRLPVSDLFKGVERLFSSEILSHHILLTLAVDPESLCVTADKQLLEQVLINLVTNSIHALTGRSAGKIKLAAFTDLTGKIWIQVVDNGVGISEEISDKIFIPFFTTREKGSGIGLSLSRQIMRLHNGKISFTSVPGRETVFSLVFERQT